MTDYTDPTPEQIAAAFAMSYRPEGVELVMLEAREQLETPEGRRNLYGRALALAEGVFS